MKIYILQQVIQAENLPNEQWTNLKERLNLLNENGYLTSEIRDALHFVRQISNKAAHGTRRFRYSEALLSWEAIYTIVKWNVEVYGPVDSIVPEYVDPSPKEKTYDISELEERLKVLEEMLRLALHPEPIRTGQKKSVTIPVNILPVPEQPGFTTIRSLTYKGQTLDIPYFLRDAFLLPQRFDKSETFLIRLGAEQQARIMSELPNDLEGLHKHVKRYTVKNDENLFGELITYIEEEKIRRQLLIEVPGELFFYYKVDYIVVTEELAKIPFTVDEFTGSPSLLKQLKEDQIEKVGQLPNELVILAKYENVGIGTVEKVFEQLKGKQPTLTSI